MTKEIDSSGWVGDKDEGSERLRNIIQQGTKIAGGAVGSALGFFAAGPAGAAVLGAMGTMASESLAHIGEEVASRMLGPREMVRVGGVLALAAERIQERIAAGDHIRDDDFFAGREGERSNADEVAESLILKAQREAEEKKIPFIANMLANIAFDPSVTVETAHQLSKTAEALTYRQLCIVRASQFMKGSNVQFRNFRSMSAIESPLMETLYETFDLMQRGLISQTSIHPPTCSKFTREALEHKAWGSASHADAIRADTRTGLDGDYRYPLRMIWWFKAED